MLHEFVLYKSNADIDIVSFIQHFLKYSTSTSYWLAIDLTEQSILIFLIY